MNSKIEKIYELLYSPLVTPFNLLENAKLENYEYVKYYKEKSSFVAEMKYKDFSGESTVCYYYFDEKNYLECIFKQQGAQKLLMFDRNREVQKRKGEFINSRKIDTRVV